MTAVTQWQPKKGRHWAQSPLPEPPRHRRLAKSAPKPTDKVGRDLEDWLRDLTVTTTLDAD
jgi:hypothetical protein